MGHCYYVVAHLGLYWESQDIWRAATDSRACHGGHLLILGPDVPLGYSAPAEQCEGIWGRLLFWVFLMCFLFLESTYSTSALGSAGWCSVGAADAQVVPNDYTRGWWQSGSLIY